MTRQRQDMLREPQVAAREEAAIRAKRFLVNLRWGLRICWFFIFIGAGAWIYCSVAPLDLLWKPHQMFWPVLLLVPAVLYLARNRKLAAQGLQLVQEGDQQQVDAFWPGYDDLAGTLMAVEQPQELPLLAAGRLDRRFSLGETRHGPLFQAWLFSSGQALGNEPQPVALYWPGALFVGRLLPFARRRELILARKSRFMWLMAALFVLAWGLCGLLYVQTDNKLQGFLDNRRLAEQSQDWPTATARIVESSIKQVKLGKGRIKVKAWVLEARYVYSVASRQLQGERVSFCPDPKRRKSLAREKHEQLLLARPLHVYYAPDTPELSVLEPGGGERCAKNAREERIYRDYMTPGLWLLCTGLLLWAVLRKRRQFRRLEERGWL